MDQEQLHKNTISDGYSPLPEDADLFVPVPEQDGLIDYAVIPEDLAKVAHMRPVPIRLVNGKHFGNGGYGVAHLLYGHAPAIAVHGYQSVQDFVDEVAVGFDAVYRGHKKDRRVVVRRKDENLAVNRLLILELAKTNDYYSVVTGWTVSARRPIPGELLAERTNKEGVTVWECRAPHSKGPG